MPDQVLIAYDGSVGAREAIRHAGKLFAGSHAVVMNVWQSLAGLLLHTDVHSLTGTMREVVDEVDATDRERAERIVADGCRLAREAGMVATPLLAEGKAKAWPELLRAADREGAAVVVVGSSGLSGIESALLGSVSVGVLHHSTRPVLLVPPADRAPAADGGPLLVGYDGSEHAKRAIECAGALLGGHRALVVTVWTSIRASASAAVLGVPAGVATAGAEKLDAEIAARAESSAAEGAELARAAGLDAHALAEQARGNTWATLVQLAYEQHPAAVVVGSHGRSSLKEALLGSVSRGLVTHSPAPVLAVPLRRST